jgi:hypothetical protein
MESTLRLEPQVDELITELLSKLNGAASSEQTINIGYWLQLFAFDVIGAFSFSKPYGFLSSGSDSVEEDKNFFARIERSMHSSGWLMHAGWLFRLHQNFILPLFGNWLAINERNGFFFQFAQREVQARKDQGGNDKDIVGQLFQAQQIKEELYVTPTICADKQPLYLKTNLPFHPTSNDLAISYMMTSNVFAGSDTTALALSGIFLNLMRHPQILAKLRAELQGHLAMEKFSSVVSAAEAESCQYLQAVIYEALRVFSPAAFILDRDVPPGGMTICGRHVPGGVSLIGELALYYASRFRTAPFMSKWTDYKAD